LSSLLTALQGENSGFGTITAGQWVTSLLAFFVALVGTGTVTNRVTNRAPVISEVVDDGIPGGIHDGIAAPVARPVRRRRAARAALG
jgi:hypothetical protein